VDGINRDREYGRTGRVGHWGVILAFVTSTTRV
jgi:hypothetical protein